MWGQGAHTVGREGRLISRKREAWEGKFTFLVRRLVLFAGLMRIVLATVAARGAYARRQHHGDGEEKWSPWL